MIIDESLEPAGEAKRESRKATIGWDAKIPIDEEKIIEKTSEKFHPIERITPTPTTTSTTTQTIEENDAANNIGETIVLRPQ